MSLDALDGYLSLQTALNKQSLEVACDDMSVQYSLWSYCCASLRAIGAASLMRPRKLVYIRYPIGPSGAQINESFLDLTRFCDPLIGEVLSKTHYCLRDVRPTNYVPHKCPAASAKL